MKSSRTVAAGRTGTDNEVVENGAGPQWMDGLTADPPAGPPSESVFAAVLAINHDLWPLPVNKSGWT